MIKICVRSLNLLLLFSMFLNTESFYALASDESFLIRPSDTHNPISFQCQALEEPVKSAVSGYVGKRPDQAVFFQSIAALSQSSIDPDEHAFRQNLGIAMDPGTRYKHYPPYNRQQDATIYAYTQDVQLYGNSDGIGGAGGGALASQIVKHTFENGVREGRFRSGMSDAEVEDAFMVLTREASQHMASAGMLFYQLSELKTQNEQNALLQRKMVTEPFKVLCAALKDIERQSGERWMKTLFEQPFSMPQELSRTHLQGNEETTGFDILASIAMGATFVGAVEIKGRGIDIFHIGDSRAIVRYSDGAIEQITEDHSMASLGITEEGDDWAYYHSAEHQENRSAITSSIGSDESDYPLHGFMAIPTGEIDELLLTSDGLTGYFLAQLLQSSERPAAPPFLFQSEHFDVREGKVYSKRTKERIFPLYQTLGPLVEKWNHVRATYLRPQNQASAMLQELKPVGTVDNLSITLRRFTHNPTGFNAMSPEDIWVREATEILANGLAFHGDMTLATETIQAIRDAMGDAMTREYLGIWLSFSRPLEVQFSFYAPSPEAFQDDILRVIPYLQTLISKTAFGPLIYEAAHDVFTLISGIALDLEDKLKIDSLGTLRDEINQLKLRWNARVQEAQAKPQGSAGADSLTKTYPREVVDQVAEDLHRLFGDHGPLIMQHWSYAMGLQNLPPIVPYLMKEWKDILEILEVVMAAEEMPNLFVLTILEDLIQVAHIIQIQPILWPQTDDIQALDEHLQDLARVHSRMKDKLELAA